jgi:hypothetical protein
MIATAKSKINGPLGKFTTVSSESARRRAGLSIHHSLIRSPATDVEYKLWPSLRPTLSFTCVSTLKRPADPDTEDVAPVGGRVAASGCGAKIL